MKLLGKLSKYSEGSLVEKLPVKKINTYLIIFLRTVRVHNIFDCTVFTTKFSKIQQGTAKLPLSVLKSKYNVVTNFASTFLIGSSSFLQVTRATI